jgi:riboflavin transporter 2
LIECCGLSFVCTVLVLVLASVDCSSRVLYLPFMASLRPEYLSSYFIGEGLSGFIPSIFALIQGAGESSGCVNVTVGEDSENSTATIVSVPSFSEPLFSIEVFFYLMAFVTVMSAVAFHLLNIPSVVGRSRSEALTTRGGGTDKEHATKLLDVKTNKKFYNTTPIIGSTDDGQNVCARNTMLSEGKPSNSNLLPFELEVNQGSTDEGGNYTLSSGQFVYLMVLLAVICGLANGVFPSIQSYSCMPYGTSTYHIAVTLSNMANPAVCFLMLLMKTPDRRLATVMTFPALVVSSYVFYSALLSPNPPFVDSSWGGLLLVRTFICLSYHIA